MEIEQASSELFLIVFQLEFQVKANDIEQASPQLF